MRPQAHHHRTGGTAINYRITHHDNGALDVAALNGTTFLYVIADTDQRRNVLHRAFADIAAELTTGDVPPRELPAGRGVPRDAAYDAINAVIACLPPGAISADDLAIALYTARYGHPASDRADG